MAKSAKPRKKYRPQQASFASPLVSRALSDTEKQRLRDLIDVARLKIRLASTDRAATDRLAAYIAYGYLVAENFARGDELKERFKKGLQAIYRVRWAIDFEQTVHEEDIALIDETADYAYDEIITLDVRTLQKLQDYYRVHAEKLFEIALRDIGGNRVMVLKKSHFQKMLAEGKLPKNAVIEMETAESAIGEGLSGRNTATSGG